MKHGAMMIGSWLAVRKNRRLGLAVLILATPMPALAIEPVPGSAEMPLVYTGPALLDPQAPDGRMPLCVGVQNFQISRASRQPSPLVGGGPGFTYQHHVDMACWKGRLYAAWGISPKDEDTTPNHIVYSTSEDGVNWSEPALLFPPNGGWNMRFYFYRASNGRMLAFATTPFDFPEKKFYEREKSSVVVREITADHQLGPVWTLIKPGSGTPPSFEGSDDAAFVAACREASSHGPLLEQQDLGALLGDKRMKWHDAANWPGGKMAGLDDHWVFGKAFCFFHRKDGRMVGLSKLGYTTLSGDDGNSWSLPVIPNGLVTGTGKIWGQATPDGRYAMIHTPQSPGPRYPMVVVTSDDGITFADMCVIHGDVPPQRYVGGHKGTGPQYLRGIAEWAGDARTLDSSAIWVTYSVHKEDIWVSRIPVPVTQRVTQEANDNFDDIKAGPRVPGWNTYSPAWAPVRIVADVENGGHCLELEDREPVDYARAVRLFPEGVAFEVSFDLSALQSGHGRLEIDILGENGSRPVRVLLDGKGGISAADGERQVDLGGYEAQTRASYSISVNDGRFSLMRDKKVLLENAAFTESASKCHGVSFRTGEFRAKVARPPQKDLPNTEKPDKAAIYRIDNFVTRRAQPTTKR